MSPLNVTLHFFSYVDISATCLYEIDDLLYVILLILNLWGHSVFLQSFQFCTKSIVGLE